MIKAKKRRRLVDYLRIMAYQRATPEAIALGLCIGLFVGFSPFYGMHMTLALLFAFLLRGSKITALLTVWITNPLTALPIYSFTFMLGSRLLGTSVKNRSLISFINYCMEEIQWQNVDRPYKVLTEAYRLGKGVLPPLLVGGFAVAVIASSICYPVVGSAIHFLRGKRRNRLCSRRGGEAS